MSDLILELYTEEIPALMQQNAEEGYRAIFIKNFEAMQISFQELNTYIGPRRIVIHVTGLPKKTLAKHLDLKGPRVGAPQQALDGFCKTNNISINQTQIEEIGGIEYHTYKAVLPEIDLQNILPKLICDSISEYIWPKSMYWGNYGMKNVRPMLNILCLFDDNILEFTHEHLASNNYSFGHRFVSNDKFIVKSWTDYISNLEKNFVILERSQRLNIINRDIEIIRQENKLLVPLDNRLLEEVAGLVEYPVVLLGKIPEKFMHVPKEILILAMKTHQKYFYTTYEDGTFAPYFIFVSNLPNAGEDVILGNERVLSARLSDAAYFYIQDQKTSLESRLEKLKNVVFHAKLGSIFDKAERLVKMSEYIAPQDIHLKKAALLCKADLVTEAVVEFPELQGIMGSYYAALEGFDKETSQAIKNHYLPMGNNDDIPTHTASFLSLIDKVDSLVGLMLAGERATGSKDPYALRRYAIGIIRIILKNQMTEINIRKLIEYNLSLFPLKEEVKDEILSFIEDRLKGYFKDQYDIKLINAATNLSHDDNLCSIEKKLQILQGFIHTKKGQSLIQLYSRVTNILKGQDEVTQIDISKFKEKEEEILHEASQKIIPALMEASKNKDYTKAFEELSNLEEPIAEFFDNVLVNDEDKSIANNRRAILSYISKAFDSVIKFECL
ncbi:MAG: Glycine--tRNA ligase beta subunit [Pseudomonadota bacterium]|jgi:glycyl-tRNA synthetase beta chain